MRMKDESLSDLNGFWRRGLGRTIGLYLGMSGLRLDRGWGGSLFAVWVAGWIATWVAFKGITEHGWLGRAAEEMQVWAWSYAGLVWMTYYVLLLGVGLGTPFRHRLIRRWGETKAFAFYEAVLGVVFLNQGLCQVAVMKTHDNTGLWFESEVLTRVVGGAMMVLGFAWKAWATHVTGMDTYYYRDMFLGRATLEGKAEPWVATGPYRYTANPMYGLGNLQAYGAAIWYGFAPGLVVAFLFQSSIYAFYALWERRFIRRVYGTPRLREGQSGDSP